MIMENTTRSQTNKQTYQALNSIHIQYFFLIYFRSFDVHSK